MHIYIYIFMWLYISRLIINIQIYELQNVAEQTYMRIWRSIGCETRQAFLFRVTLWGLMLVSYDSFWCVDMAIQLNFIAGVWKRCYMTETLWHYKFGPSVVLGTLELYIYIYICTCIYIYIYIVRPVVSGRPREGTGGHGRPLETTGDHRN